MLFGGYDSSFLKSEIVWLPLVGNTWWQVKMLNTQYGPNSVAGPNTTTCIMDTGTSLITVPNFEFIRLSAMWQQDYKGVQCSTELCYTAGTCQTLA